MGDNESHVDFKLSECPRYKAAMPAPGRQQLFHLSAPGLELGIGWLESILLAAPRLRPWHQRGLDPGFFDVIKGFKERGFISLHGQRHFLFHTTQQTQTFDRCRHVQRGEIIQGLEVWAGACAQQFFHHRMFAGRGRVH